VQHLELLGHSPHPATFFGEPDGVRHVSSDLAFWGGLVFQGNYDGFRIIKNTPGNPTEISHTHCKGDQGVGEHPRPVLELEEGHGTQL
jgi:hypothetical protein